MHGVLFDYWSHASCALILPKKVFIDGVERRITTWPAGGGASCAPVTGHARHRGQTMDGASWLGRGIKMCKCGLFESCIYGLSNSGSDSEVQWK